MNRELILTILYEMAMAIGSEVNLQPLLTRTIQKLLYHTSFPCGMIFLFSDEYPGLNSGESSVEFPLRLAIGDYDLTAYNGRNIQLPITLLKGRAELIEDANLLKSIPSSRVYTVALRLPVDNSGVILLLSSSLPKTTLPLTQIFQPVMNVLARAILLCRRNEEFIQEEALKQSEKKYSSLIQKIRAAVVVHDSDTKIIMSNSTAQSLLGLSEDQLTGKAAIDPDWHFLRDDGSQMAIEDYPVNQIIASKKPMRDVVIGIHQPGKNGILWALVNGDPVFDNDNDILQIIITFVDITDRKQAEEELQERERHSQSLLRLSRDLERSQTYAEVLKVAQDEVKNIIGYQNLWAYLLTEDKKYAKALVARGPFSERVMSEDGTATLVIEGDPMLEKIAQAKEIVIVEDAQTDKQVNRRIVEQMKNRTIVNVPIILFDRHMGSVGTGTFGDEGVRVPSAAEQKYLIAMASHMAVAFDRMHLIAERRRVEEEIRELNADLEKRVTERTAELEAANKELEAFAYSVSHDLRAPLRHLDGFVSLLKEEKLDEKGQHYLDVILKSARKMNTLIEDLLSFSRMGRVKISTKKVDLNVLIQEIIKEMETDFGKRIIKWKISNLPAVNADLSMIRQAFYNLLSNAVKFTKTREKAVIEIGSTSTESESVIFIRDNGVGFNMSQVEKLFGVFQRLHSEEEFEGTGIGLANVKRIIARHGGKVWAEAEEDKGATFYVSLPKFG